jgi:hypothetical protein
MGGPGPEGRPLGEGKMWVPRFSSQGSLVFLDVGSFFIFWGSLERLLSEWQSSRGAYLREQGTPALHFLRRSCSEETLAAVRCIENSPGGLPSLPAHARNSSPRDGRNSEGRATTTPPRGFSRYSRPLCTFDQQFAQRSSGESSRIFGLLWTEN